MTRPQARGYVKGRPTLHGPTNGYEPPEATPYLLDMPVYMSEKAKPGFPITVQYDFLSFSNGIYMHPIDYFWFKWGERDPAFAESLCAQWRERRIDQMVIEAYAHIDEMVNSMNLSAMFKSSLIAVEHAKRGDLTLTKAFVQGAKAA